MSVKASVLPPWLITTSQLGAGVAPSGLYTVPDTVPIASERYTVTVTASPSLATRAAVRPASKPLPSTSAAMTTKRPSVSASAPPKRTMPLSAPAWPALRVIWRRGSKNWLLGSVSGKSSCSIVTCAPGIGCWVTLERTFTVTSARPSRRAETSAVSPALTEPCTTPILPVESSFTTSVKVPALTRGKRKRPPSRTGSAVSWIPCGMLTQEVSPPLLSLQNDTNSSDL